jgi:hypothetical protein
LLEGPDSNAKANVLTSSRATNTNMTFFIFFLLRHRDFLERIP